MSCNPGRGSGAGARAAARGPDLKKILWKKVGKQETYIQDVVGAVIPIEADIIPTIDVLTNQVESILITSPDRSRSFIEMESRWDVEKERMALKKCQMNYNLRNEVGMVMRGYLKRENRCVRLMFTKRADMESLKKDDFDSVITAQMYAIDYGVIRDDCDVSYLWPLKPSELMPPFGIRAQLYEEWCHTWRPLSHAEVDGGEFRHFCVNNRHQILVKEITYDDLGIPTAHIRVLPPLSFPSNGTANDVPVKTLF